MSLQLLKETLARIEADETLPEKLKAEMLEETKRRIAKHGHIEHNWGAPIERSQPPEREEDAGTPAPAFSDFQDGF